MFLANNLCDSFFTALNVIILLNFTFAKSRSILEIITKNWEKLTIFASNEEKIYKYFIE